MEEETLFDFFGDLDVSGEEGEVGSLVPLDEVERQVEESRRQIETSAPEEREVSNQPDLLSSRLSVSASGKLLRQYLMSEGFGNHHVEVYDNWINNSAYNNVYGRTLTISNDSVVSFKNLMIMHPRYSRDGKDLPLTPKLAREQGITYGNDWYVDVVVTPLRGPQITRPHVCIGSIPTMLGSRNCILHGKSPRELALLGEDPKDSKGYFIVQGTEKIVLLQEQLSVNKIFLMSLDTKGTVVTRMTVNTSRGTALVELGMNKKKEHIKIRFPSMRDVGKKKKAKKFRGINVLRVFRLLGISDEDRIIDMISWFIKPEHVKKCILKLTHGLVNYQSIPDDEGIIMAKLGKTREKDSPSLRFKNAGEPLDAKKEIERILETDLFPHLNNMQGPDREKVEQKRKRIITAKLHLLSIMIARFLEYLAGYRSLDDRNSWSNKRIGGAGRMMEQLFRGAWKKTLRKIQDVIDTKKFTDIGKIVGKLRVGIITDTFTESFMSGKWGVKGMQIKNNVAQPLNRDSIVATFAHISTIDVVISRTDRQHLLRIIQNTQWGFVCPASTPERENAGIVKSTSLTTRASLETSDTQIIRELIGDTGKDISARVTTKKENKMGWTDKIMCNGKPMGWGNAEEIRDHLVSLRRSGQLFQDMSVIIEDDWLYVDIGFSRPMRPLLIVDEDQRLAIDRLRLRGAPIRELLTSGAMEYMSPWEQEHIKSASTVEDIKKRLDDISNAERSFRAARAEHKSDPTNIEAKKRLDSAKALLEKERKKRAYTHCELDPLAILGVAASLIPWANHNQAPRNTYQVSMGKQALGIYHSNHLNRFDGKTKILAFPTKPMVETEIHDVVGLDERPSGENLNVAFIAYPFTEEDSFIVKKEFLESGGFWIYKYLTYKTIVVGSGVVAEELTKPELSRGEPPDRYKYIQMFAPNNPSNGLPMIGAPLRQGDCVIGKMQRVTETEEIRNESVFLHVGEEGIVEKVLVSSDNKITTVTVKIRALRIPQEGDKFAPRNAQKGTIGLVMSDVDMPFDENGIIPDMIVNPHSIPSRMTMEYIMEIIAAKYGSIVGKHINGTAFEPFRLPKYRSALKNYGRDEYGYENMRSGTTGKPLEVPIYSGPVFFQALKHHVLDKMQVRSTGQVKPMTRQPPRGRGNKGGLRFGEMERDNGISHGASAFLRERLMFASDAYQAVFCKTCGAFAVNIADIGTYKDCVLCKGSTFGRCTIPYAYKLLIHLLAAPGINLHPEFIDSQEYLVKLFGKKEPQEPVDIIEELQQLDEVLEDEQQELEREMQEEEFRSDS